MAKMKEKSKGSQSGQSEYGVGGIVCDYKIPNRLTSSTDLRDASLPKGENNREMADAGWAKSPSLKGGKVYSDGADEKKSFKKTG